MAASVTLTACGGGSGSSGGGGSGTPSDALVKASDNPVVRMRIRGAAAAVPQHGSVTQSSKDNYTFSVNVEREGNQLNYGTSEVRDGGAPSPRASDEFVKTDHLKGDNDRFSRTTLIRSSDEGTHYIDVFTDYELPAAVSVSSTTFSSGDTVPTFESLTGDFPAHSDDSFTLNGVGGVLDCPNGCSLDKGVVTKGEYIFTPNPAPITDDTDYLVGGIWLWVDAAEKEDTRISVSASGSDPFGDENGMGIAAVTGTATYSGGARGLITEKEDGDIKPNKAFTADVVLTANFDTEMISGIVNHFTDAASVDLEAGVVTLVETSIGAANSGFFTGETSVIDDDEEATSNTGKWGGQFYGNPDSSAVGADAQPGSVAGTFGASVGDADNDNDAISILGVFGAYK